MQAVILAAGKSTRSYPITLTRPKPLIKIANKTILEHNLEQLEGIDEVILIVGFKKEAIKNFLKKEFRFRIRIIEQKNLLGTWDALKRAERVLKGRFIVLGGDDIFHKKDIQNCLRYKNSVLIQKVKDVSKFGHVVEKKGVLVSIKEKPEKKTPGYAYTGLSVLEKDIFKVITEKSDRGEHELTSAVNKYSKKKNIHCVRVTQYWLPVGYPWHIIEANEVLLSRIKNAIMGKVEKNVRVVPPVILGKGSLIRNGAYIEGPVAIGKNSIVGPNSYIRKHTSIGDNCEISNSVEIDNSVIMDNTSISKLTYIGDSIIGKGARIGQGTIMSNSGKGEVKTVIRGRRLSTGRKEFGCVIGDRVHIGKNTYIYPGSKIYPNKRTKPGEVVKRDIM